MSDEFVDDAFDVESLRKSWEIEDHWIMRRDFIMAHKDKFPLNRLLCLAQLFVNVETLGNGYDPKIMTLIKELEKDVTSLGELRMRRENLNDINAQKLKVLEQQNKDKGFRRNYNNAYGYNAQRPKYDNRNNQWNSRQNYNHQPNYGRNSGQNHNQYSRNSWPSQGQSYAQQPYYNPQNTYNPNPNPNASSYGAQHSYTQSHRRETNPNPYDSIPSYFTSESPSSASSNPSRRSAASFFKR